MTFFSNKTCKFLKGLIEGHKKKPLYKKEAFQYFLNFINLHYKPYRQSVCK